MKRLATSFTQKICFNVSFLLFATLSLSAQELATVINRNDATQLAVENKDIESITILETANVDPAAFASTGQTAKSKWAGKRIGFLGNSITEFGEYVRAYAALTGCEAVNYGVSATHMARVNSSDSQAFEVRCARMASNLDMVIVFGGTNDFGHTNTAPFGTFGDGTKSGLYTFYAGLHRLFYNLTRRYRDKPIVVMTPVHHGTAIDCPEYIINSDGTLTENTNPTTGKTFREYVDAIKEVAAYYSIIVLDAYRYSGLSPMAERSISGGYYFRDGLHLNDRGGERLARWMYPQLEQVYDMFYFGK